MTSSRLSPQKVTDDGIKRLKAMADPVRAEGAQRYFKETVPFLGTTASDLRTLADEIFRKVKSEWGVDEAAAFCSLMLENPYHDVRAVGILVFEKFRKQFLRTFFQTIKSWLRADFCNSWALVDTLCPNSMEALFEKYPDLVEEIKGWSRSPKRWVRRASIVSFIKLAKKPGYLGAIYDIVRLHLADHDDLIQKASGWLLREAGKTDPARLERFLRQNGPAIPRTTLRYAIERFPEAKRRSLLMATKKPRSLIRGHQP